jgi:transcriptional regulator GlxA family with amidase domain
MSVSTFFMPISPTRAQTAMTKTARPMRIALLAYEGCMGTEVFGVADVLLVAGHLARALLNVERAPFDVQVVGLGARAVRVAGGVSITVKRPRGAFDLLIVPGLEISGRDQWDARMAPLQREIGYIRRTFARGVPVASACVGAFLLGEAGLLTGRKVTTAWLFAPELASRYPTARVCADAVLMEDGAVTTGGAVSSAFDLAIHIVQRSLGSRIARATARVALLGHQRSSQAPYVDEQLMPRSMAAFSQGVTQWLGSRLGETYDLARLAQAFHVSARTLLRRFKAETGQSPLAWLRQARVEKAKQLLESTSWSVARVTDAAGYADVASFSRLFTGQVGESPVQYRRRVHRAVPSFT